MADSDSILDSCCREQAGDPSWLWKLKEAEPVAEPKSAEPGYVLLTHFRIAAVRPASNRKCFPDLNISYTDIHLA